MHRYRRLAAFGIAVALIAVVAGVASAHDTWLIANSETATVGSSITLRLTSGELFPNDDFAIDPVRVTRATVRINGASSPLSNPRTTPLALQYRWVASKAGVATFGIELAPEVLTCRALMLDGRRFEFPARPFRQRPELASVVDGRKIFSMARHAVGRRIRLAWS